MASNWKTVEGVTFRLILEEVNDEDRQGCRLLYLASLYLQVRGSSRMHLVRRSRIPGLAVHIERGVRLGRVDVGRLIDTLRFSIPAA